MRLKRRDDLFEQKFPLVYRLNGLVSSEIDGFFTKWFLIFPTFLLMNYIQVCWTLELVRRSLLIFNKKFCCLEFLYCSGCVSDLCVPFLLKNIGIHQNTLRILRLITLFSLPSFAIIVYWLKTHKKFVILCEFFSFSILANTDKWTRKCG